MKKKNCRCSRRSLFVLLAREALIELGASMLGLPVLLDLDVSLCGAHDGLANRASGERVRILTSV
jgi:hypothetical protein